MALTMWIYPWAIIMEALQDYFKDYYCQNKKGKLALEHFTQGFHLLVYI